jgi:hypothetical protein
MIDIDIIIALRLQFKTIEEIAQKMKCSRPLIGWHIRKAYCNADAVLKQKLDIVSDYLSRRIKEKITDITDYQLGIIWSIGSWIESEGEMGVLNFKHQNKYFLEQLQNICNYNIYSQITPKEKLQHVLKTQMIDIKYLKSISWTERNSNKRDLPELENYCNFIRAYMEIHSGLDYCTCYDRQKRKYHKLRLRIYGNNILIQSITNILQEHAGIPAKKIQIIHNNKTAYIAYTSYEQIQKIFDYITGDPRCAEYWDDIELKMKKPIIY